LSAYASSPGFELKRKVNEKNIPTNADTVRYEVSEQFKGSIAKEKVHRNKMSSSEPESNKKKKRKKKGGSGSKDRTGKLG
jgi:hypothetical protein